MNLNETKQLIRAESIKGLKETLLAFVNKSSERWIEASEDVLQNSKRPVYVLSLDEIVDLFVAIDSGELNIAEVSPIIRFQEEQLLAAIGGHIFFDVEGLQDWGVRLTSYVAGVVTPCFAHLGEFELAAKAVDSLVRVIADVSFDKVIGGGTQVELSDRYIEKGTNATQAALTFRYKLLDPILCSLCAFYPNERSKENKMKTVQKNLATRISSSDNYRLVIEQTLHVISRLGRISPCTELRSASLAVMNESNERSLVYNGAEVADARNQSVLGSALREFLSANSNVHKEEVDFQKFS